MASHSVCVHARRRITHVRECKPHNHHIQIITTTSFIRYYRSDLVCNHKSANLPKNSVCCVRVPALRGERAWGLHMGRRRRAGRTGRRHLTRFRLRAHSAPAGPSRTTAASSSPLGFDRERTPAREPGAPGDEGARPAGPERQSPSPMGEDRRTLAAPIREKEEKTGRGTDSLQPQEAAMNAPNEKKRQTDNAPGDHANSAGGRREPFGNSKPAMFKGAADRPEPRHRLLNDADNSPEPSLHANKSARGTWLAGTLSFSTVGAILFLVWGGIELIPTPERIPIPSHPATSLEPSLSPAPGRPTRP